MKKSKRIYKIIFIALISIYAIYTLLSQQQTLNQYSETSKELSTQIEEAKETKEELAKQKENVDSLEFIEQMARESLDMYYPNERVYVNTGM